MKPYNYSFKIPFSPEARRAHVSFTYSNGMGSSRTEFCVLPLQHGGEFLYNRWSGDCGDAPEDARGGVDGLSLLFCRLLIREDGLHFPVVWGISSHPFRTDLILRSSLLTFQTLRSASEYGERLRPLCSPRRVIRSDINRGEGASLISRRNRLKRPYPVNI